MPRTLRPPASANLFNALLPVSKSFDESEFADISSGALRASIQQLLAALG